MKENKKPFKAEDGFYHYVYETTNLINGKKYIGKHSTRILKDNYIGCGVTSQKSADRISKTNSGFPSAVSKYKYNNFKKEILQFFDTSEQALKEESKLVCSKVVNSKDYYNQIKGGGGTSIYLENKGLLGLEEFIKRGRETHGDLYDYTLSDYKDIKTDLIIICREHGPFRQTPDSHIRGAGCHVCGGSKKKTLTQFIKQAKDVHKDRFDYSKVVYKNNKTNVIIICREHGEFLQTPKDHLTGKGCRKCTGLDKKDTEYFIRKSQEVHGNRYDYSLSEYEGIHIKLKIICKEHGVFEMRPRDHYSGQNCKKCRKNLTGIKVLDTNTGLEYPSLAEYCRQHPELNYKAEHKKIRYKQSHLSFIE